jgi:trans-aconitate 2-methyltransferase
MAAWDPAQYLRFERERTQPCRDLVARIELEAPRRIVDLGCGPGNSTAVLRARWPTADLTGVDRSGEMLEVARRSDPRVSWVAGDIGRWTANPPADLLFSNAALHWLPDHAQQFPRLFAQVAPNGAFAVQMPANDGAPYQRAADRVFASPEWRSCFPPEDRDVALAAPEFYHDLLAPLAHRIDLWDTRYVHVLPDANAVVEWTKGTGLRPALARLPDDAHRERFLAQYGREVARAYPPRPDGQVLFPFLRRFLIAYR